MQQKFQTQKYLHPKSTLKPSYSIQTQSYKVFIQTDLSNVTHITLQAQNPTVREVIILTLEELNERLGLKLRFNPQKYHLFFAKKDGKKCQDLPSLEFHQPIKQFKHRRFYIQPIDKNTSIVPTIPYFSDVNRNRQISTSISIQKQKTHEKSEKTSWGCFCIK